MKRTIVLVIIGVMLGGLFSSCGKKDQSGATKTIGVTLLTRGHGLRVTEC